MYKTIILDFNKPLTEEQENILIASFQFLVKKAKKQLLKSQKAYKYTNKFMLGEKGKIIKETIALTLENFDDMFILVKNPSNTIYTFKMDSKLQSLSINFGLFKFDYWEKMKSVYTKFLYKQILPQMKIKRPEVETRFSESDR